MKNSHIEWCDHTFNPWIGCTKVSPGCTNCYAETLNKRWKQGRNWGKGAPRYRTGAAYWREPLQWNQRAWEFRSMWPNGPYHRPRVFCASLADWLDDEVPIKWLADLLYLVSQCHALDWLLLTKRPQNFLSRLRLAAEVKIPWIFDNVAAGEAAKGLLYNVEKGHLLPSNIWIGTSVENQQYADERIPQLLDIPAKVRFLSCEPLLAPLNLVSRCQQRGAHYKTITGTDWLGPDERKIHWVICGGESGPGARPMHPEWARSLRDQCVAAGVPFFFKQWGEWAPYDRGGIDSRLLARPGSLDEPLGKFGKKLSGRLLDGSEYSQFPT